MRTLRATVKARGVQRERRFPLGTSKRTIQDWKDRERGRLKDERPPASRGTFAKDVERYLDTLADRRALKKERTYQLDWWIARVGKLRRSAITAPLIRTALAELRTKQAASTCNHYRMALAHLWSTLDGKNGVNPVRDVPTFEEPEAEPRQIPTGLVTRILDAMPALGQTKKGQKRSRVSLTRLRFIVMVTTGLSPAEIMRILPGDLHLAERVVYVRRRRKGKGSSGMLLPLGAEGAAALEAFADAGAFGRFSTHAAYQSWVRACKTVLKDTTLTNTERRILERCRPYDLRHTYATHLLLSTHNIGTTRELMRHRSAKTTKRYAGAAVLPHLRAAVDALPLLLPAAARPHGARPVADDAAQTPQADRKESGGVPLAQEMRSETSDQSGARTGSTRRVTHG